MRDFLDNINTREIVLLFAVGVACYFIGSGQGLRDQDSRVITELRQSSQNLVDANKKIVKVVNFAIKQDTTGAVINMVKKAGLKTK